MASLKNRASQALQAILRRRSTKTTTTPKSNPNLILVSKKEPSSAGKNWVRILLAFLTPVILSPLLIIPMFLNPKDTTKENFAAQLKWVYIALLVGIYLTFNVFSIPVTSVLPFILIPLIGIQNSAETASVFTSSVSLLQFGSFVLAIAINSSNLKNRITLLILMKTSGSIQRIFIVLFVTSLVFSMLVNSSLGTLVLVKVINGILEEMRLEVGNGTLGDGRITIVNDLVEVREEILEKQEEQQLQEGEVQEEERVKAEPSQSALVVQQEEAPEEDDEIPVAPQIDVEEVKLFVDKFEHENEMLLKYFGGELLYTVAVAANIGESFLPTRSAVGNDLFSLEYVHSAITTRKIYNWSVLTWIMYSFPLILINASIALSFLVYLHFGKGSFSQKLRKLLRLKEARLCRLEQSPVVLTKLGKLFSEKYAHLRKGGWSFLEIVCLVLVVVYIIVDFTRWPVNWRGWAELIKKVITKKQKETGSMPAIVNIDVSSSVLVILISFILFWLPKSGLKMFQGPSASTDKPNAGGLVGWKHVQDELPWSILFFIGGSRAIGKISSKTIAEPILLRLTKYTKSDSTIKLRLIMMGLIIPLGIIIPNPGVTLVAQSILQNAFLLPSLSVAYLAFMIPSASVPNAIVYLCKGDKELSPWYFLKVGLPIFILTVIPTLGYAIAWTVRGLTIV